MLRAGRAREAPVAERTCGACTACCRVLGVVELGKPEGVPCRHIAPAGGCRIYARRPESCRVWSCAWRLGGLSEDWSPLACGMVVERVLIGGRALNRFHVPDADPDRWRREPYWSD